MVTVVLSADVLRIKALRREGWSQKKIADEIGISQNGVSQILAGKSWKHLQIES